MCEPFYEKTYKMNSQNFSWLFLIKKHECVIVLKSPWIKIGFPLKKKEDKKLSEIISAPNTAFWSAITGGLRKCLPIEEKLNNYTIL